MLGTATCGRVVQQSLQMEGLLMKSTSRLIVSIVGAMALVASIFSGVARAADVSEPKLIIERVAGELFGLVKEKGETGLSDEAYYTKVGATLDPVVNFPFIAGSVMGKAAYQKASLTERQEFLAVFKDGMVKSLAKGILNYADSQIVIAGVDQINPTRVVVKQEVSADGTTHKLDYTMVQGKDGQWKLINVVLNGVNLGQSFSSQFKSSYRKHNGDLSKVTANWLADAS
jgi:phospholipid transport system substrate-binding protein